MDCDVWFWVVVAAIPGRAVVAIIFYFSRQGLSQSQLDTRLSKWALAYEPRFYGYVVDRGLAIVAVAGDERSGDAIGFK